MNLISYYKQHSERHVAQGKLSCKCFQQIGQRNGMYNDFTQEVPLKSSMGGTRFSLSQYKKQQIWGSLPCIHLIQKGKEGLGKQRKHRQL